MQRFLLFVVVFLFVSFANAVEVSMPNPVADAEKLMQQGLPKDAVDKLRPWILDPKSAAPAEIEKVPKGIEMVVDCLGKLNRMPEVDDFLEQAVVVHRKNWRALEKIANQIGNRIPHGGVLVDNKFQRDNFSQRNAAGQRVDAEDRDRIRSLQLFVEAMPLVQQDPDKTGAADFFFWLGSCWENSSEAWKMQSLTDFSALPDFTPQEHGRRFGRYRERSYASVDEQGSPVYYSVPKSFEEAKNDGERWRWCLEQAVESDPKRIGRALLNRADFSLPLYSEETLAGYDFFRNDRIDPVEKQASIWSLETLDDTETIARLATGIKRFAIPDEFHYLALFKKVLDVGTESEKIYALERLARSAQNRRQFDKAAGYWKRLIEEFPNPKEDRRDSWQASLDQIEKNWGRFEPTPSKVAGTDAELRYVFRNGKKVDLTATEIDVEKLLADVKEYLKSKPKQLDWQRLQIEHIGWQLVAGKEGNDLRRKYLGKEVCRWSIDLQPAEKHFDREEKISVPIKKSGAYLVKAEMDAGNTEYVVLWLNDTAIVQKQLDKSNLYFVADAATGKPISSQAAEFFGYKMEWKSSPRPAGRQRRENVPDWSFKEFSSQTDADGQIILDEHRLGTGMNWLVTVKNADGRFAHLGFDNVWFSQQFDEQYKQVKAFFISDRPVYRPKDKVEFKCWVGTAKYDQPNSCDWAGKEIVYEIYDPRGEKIVEKKNVKLDAYGGFVGSLELSKDATLGVYQVNVINFGGGNFRVEEYRKPEYEVSVDAPKDPIALGDKFKATIRAKYYFGSPVTEATVKYKVLREKADADWYPIRPWDWFYGNGYGWLAYDTAWLPGWTKWGTRRPLPFWFPRHSGPPEVVAEQEVKISADGTVDVEIDTSLAKAMFPNDSQRYKITAEAVDQSRRTIVGNGTVLVAKEPFKVYAWTNRGWYEPGQKIEAGFQARRLDGKPVSGNAVVKLFKIIYKEPGTQRSAVPGQPVEETEIFSKEIALNEEGVANLSLSAAEAGQYRISCKLKEQEGGYVFNVHSNELRPVVAESAVTDRSSLWEFNDIELVPDKSEFSSNETVSLRVNTKRRDATVLLFVKPTNGICTKPQVLRMDGTSQLVRIPVTMRDMPNFFIEALTVADGRIFSETKEFAVPPEQRILNVDVKPSAETYKPGGKATAELLVTDLAGTPVSGQVVVSIYDKSVEYVSGGSNVGDIKEFFWKWKRFHHPQSPSNLEKYFQNMQEPARPGMEPIGLFGNVMQRIAGGMGGFGGGMLRNAAVPMAAAAPMMKGEVVAESAVIMDAAAPMESPKTETVEPTVRKNFADTALWIGALETNEKGIANIELDMPESLTTWKINVWSLAAGTRVGYGNAEVITRKDLILRMQTPRFLVEKDKVVFSANVHNYLANEKEVKVSLELDDKLIQIANQSRDREGAVGPGEPLPDGRGSDRVVKIPAGGEARVDWLVEAKSAGDAVVRMKAITDEESDAMEKILPIYVHGMLKTDSFSTYVAPENESGTITVNVPEARRPEETRLTVRFAPSLAVSMVDALPYLVDYPYGCTEQTLNRFLPTVIVQKTLQASGFRLQASEQWAISRKRAGVYDPDVIAEMVRDGVQKLANMQCSDGGWGWFSGYGEHSSAHQTALVVHGLLQALFNDVAVDKDALRRGIDWLKRYQKEELRKLKNGELSEEERKKLSWNDWKSAADNTDAFVYLVIVETGEHFRDDDETGKIVETEAATAMKNYLWRDRTKLSLYGVAMFGNALAASMDLTFRSGGIDFNVNGTTLFSTQGNSKPMRIPKEDKEKIDGCVKILEQYLVHDDENQTAYLNLGGYSGWCWWAWHGSEFETQAYYLKLLNRTDPKGKIAPKLVKYLLNNRRHATYWNSTRDTAICIEAFAEFLKASGEEKPNLTVEVLVDGVVKKTVEFTPESILAADGQLVLEKDAVPTGTRKIELRKKSRNDSGGPLYVNAYLEYFSLEDPIKKSGLEVKVERRIYRLDRDKSAKTQAAGGRGQVVDMKVEKYTRTLIDSSIVDQNAAPLEKDQRPTGAGKPNERKLDMPGRQVPGDLLEVELVVESKNDYESIILEDFKAAGLEPVEVRSGYNGNELGAYVEFRDERVAFFVYRLPRGKHSVTYRLRAETPGTFSALPTTIGAMYAPELKGNSDENKVSVEERP